MKRATAANLVVLLIVLVALAGAVWFTRWRDERAASAPTPTPNPTRTAVPSSTATPTSPPSTAPAPAPKPVPGVPQRPKDAQPMTVTYVYDGDTLQLRSAKPGAYVTTLNPIRVRLVGVNAPEMKPTKQCFAQQATDRLRALVPARSRVWVKPDRDSWDDYKRRLFLVWTDRGVLVDHDLVAGGYGEALRIYPNITYWPLLQQAQATAQRTKRGLWGRC